jgi:hypothetical protein
MNSPPGTDAARIVLVEDDAPLSRRIRRGHRFAFATAALSLRSLCFSRKALGPGNVPIAAHTRSVEQTEDVLILFYVALFAVVTWNADRLHQRAILASDTGADDCGSPWQLAGASQFSTLDTHAVERRPPPL